jgi:hypothetical protein
MNSKILLIGLILLIIFSFGCIESNPCDAIDCAQGFECVDGICVESLTEFPDFPENSCEGINCSEGFECIEGECIESLTEFPVFPE